MSGDSSRVRRALGLQDDISGGHGGHSRRTLVDAETAVRIGEALGAERWELAA